MSDTQLHEDHDDSPLGYWHFSATVERHPDINFDILFDLIVGPIHAYCDNLAAQDKDNANQQQVAGEHITTKGCAFSHFSGGHVSQCAFPEDEREERLKREAVQRFAIEVLEVLGAQGADGAISLLEEAASDG